MATASTDTLAVTTPATAQSAQAEPPRESRNPWTSTMVRLIEAALGDDADKVTIEAEHQLFCEPMRADVVIIKKEPNHVIGNAVMRHFETHNIIEVKSPRDTLNMKAFDKNMAYVYAYLSEKGYESKQPPITLGDLTATLISVRRPKKMMAALCEKRNYKFLETETSGIYRIAGDHIPVLMQLVITSELPKDENDKLIEWLRVFRDNLTKEETAEVYQKFENMSSNDQMKTVVNFILNVNSDALEEVRKMVTEYPKLKKVVTKWAVELGGADELIHNANVETAKKFLANSVDIDLVAQCSNLSINEVKQLKRQLQSA